jgi:Hypothetical protein (DUF2513)
MKRDVELVRQILLNIEHRGANCPLEAVRADLRHESDERIRYHLQLTIEAGWVAEVDGSLAGPHGFRLTHDGHEFIEVARGDARWRAAKAVVIEETGGQSLSMLRALLTRWAWRTILLGERRVRPRRRYRRYVERVTPLNWTDVNIPESESILSDDQVRILRRRGSRRRLRPRDGWSNDLYGDLAEELDERQPSVALPPHII